MGTKMNGAAVVLGALVALGCSGGYVDNGPNRARNQGGASGSGGAAGAGQGEGPCGVTPGPGADDVLGKWAMLEVAARLAQARTIPDPLPNSSVTLYLLTQQQTTTTLTVQGQACKQWVHDPESLAHSLIPDAYLTALEPFTLPGTYQVGADGVGTYTLEKLVQVIGAELENPETDPLPTEPTDPEVIDEDQDGHPGVTVVLSGVIPGSLYVVSRRVSTLSALTTTPERLRGILEFEAQENILVSDPVAIRDLSPVISADPETCKSTVELVRLPDDAECADIITGYETLFPGAVPQPQLPP